MSFFGVTTAGESHGPGYVVIIDGVPPGLELAVDDLTPDLDRRRPGQSKVTTQRHEADIPEILSGVFEGKTTGTSIAISIQNRDQRPKDYSEIKDKYRPGHADYTFDAKYGTRDYRGGGRSSARETSVRVAAGAVAKKLLRERYGVAVVGFVKQIGDIVADVREPESVTLEDVEANIVRCPDANAAERMIELIETVRKDSDSIGGVAEIVATGVPPGWGRARLRQAQSRPRQSDAESARGARRRIRRRLRRGDDEGERGQRRLHQRGRSHRNPDESPWRYAWRHFFRNAYRRALRRQTDEQPSSRTKRR